MESRCVLLVEDDIDIRTLLAMTLEVEGYDITAVAYAEQAWGCLLQADDVALVLTDYMLPGAPGDALIRRLRELPHPPRAILMSAHPDLEQLARACRADACFHKGNPIKELLALIHALLTR